MIILWDRNPFAHQFYLWWSFTILFPYFFGNTLDRRGTIKKSIFAINISTMHLFYKRLCMCAKSLQLYLTLCGPVDYSPPGSSVHGILQARILECVAMLSSRGSSQSRDGIQVSLCHLCWQAGSLPPGKPLQL